MVENIIIIVILALIVAGAVLYLRREKKKGSKCIGCPYGGSCGGNCSDNKK